MDENHSIAVIFMQDTDHNEGGLGKQVPFILK
jgi:hypothetical protein